MQTVRHDPQAHRFTAELNGELAQLDYELDGMVMSITHTRVPPAFRGQGIAAHLMQAALNHAQEAGLKVKPLCSYAVAYLQRQAAGCEAGRQHQEALLDEALEEMEESFPASDPPAVGGVS